MNRLDIWANILSFAIMLAEIHCSLTFFDTFMVRKRLFSKVSINKILQITFFLFSSFITASLFDSLIAKGLLFVIISYCGVSIFYYSKNYIKLLLSITMYLLIIGIDILSQTIQYFLLGLSPDFIEKVPLYFFLSASFSKIFLSLIIIIIKNVQTIHKQDGVPPFYCFIYFLQGSISIICLLSLLELTYKVEYVSIVSIIAALGLLYLNNTIFGLLEKVNSYEKNERESALARQQLENELNSLRVLSETFSNQRAFLHDYKEHLAALNMLISNEDFLSAKGLIDSLYVNMPICLYRFRTNNEIVDIILNQKYIEAEKENISLDIRASDLSALSIDPCYLITILSNAIDNAIEACENLTFNIKKIISIKLVIENNIFIFSVINPVNSDMSIKINENRIQSTKSDHLVHGFGLKNISSALSKCNGDYELGCNGKKFQFTAFIRL